MGKRKRKPTPTDSTSRSVRRNLISHKFRFLPTPVNVPLLILLRLIRVTVKRSPFCLKPNRSYRTENVLWTHNKVTSLGDREQNDSPCHFSRRRSNRSERCTFKVFHYQHKIQGYTPISLFLKNGRRHQLLLKLVQFFDNVCHNLFSIHLLVL